MQRYTSLNWEDILNDPRYAELNHSQRLRAYDKWSTPLMEVAKQNNDVSLEQLLSDAGRNVKGLDYDAPNVWYQQMGNAAVQSIAQSFIDIGDAGNIAATGISNFTRNLFGNNRRHKAYENDFFEGMRNMEQSFRERFPTDPELADSFILSTLPRAAGSVVGFAIPGGMLAKTGGRLVSVNSKVGSKLAGVTGLAPSVGKKKIKDILLKPYEVDGITWQAYGNGAIQASANPLMRSGVLATEKAMARLAQKTLANQNVGYGIVGAAQASGQVYKEAIDKGAYHNAGLATLMGGAIGSLEAVPLTRLFARAEGLNQSWLWKGLVGGIEEAIQEAGSEVAFNANAKLWYDQNRDIFDAAGLAHSAGAGGIIGALMGMHQGYMGQRRAKLEQERGDPAERPVLGTVDYVQARGDFETYANIAMDKRSNNETLSATEIDVLRYVDNYSDREQAVREYAADKGITIFSPEDRDTLEPFMYTHATKETSADPIDTAFGRYTEGSTRHFLSDDAWNDPALKDTIEKYPLLLKVHANQKDFLKNSVTFKYEDAKAKGLVRPAEQKLADAIDQVPLFSKKGISVRPNEGFYISETKPGGYEGEAAQFVQVTADNPVWGKYYEADKPKFIIPTRGTNTRPSRLFYSAGKAEVLAEEFAEGLYKYIFNVTGQAKRFGHKKHRGAIIEGWQNWLKSLQKTMSLYREQTTNQAEREAVGELLRKLKAGLEKPNSNAAIELWSDVILAEMGYASDMYGSAYSKLLNSFSGLPGEKTWGEQAYQNLLQIPGMERVFEVMRKENSWRNEYLTIDPTQAGRMFVGSIAADTQIPDDETDIKIFTFEGKQTKGKPPKSKKAKKQAATKPIGEELETGIVSGKPQDESSKPIGDDLEFGKASMKAEDINILLEQSGIQKYYTKEGDFGKRINELYNEGGTYQDVQESIQNQFDAFKKKVFDQQLKEATPEQKKEANEIFTNALDSVLSAAAKTYKKDSSATPSEPPVQATPVSEPPARGRTPKDEPASDEEVAKRAAKRAKAERKKAKREKAEREKAEREKADADANEWADEQARNAQSFPEDEIQGPAIAGQAVDIFMEGDIKNYLQDELGISDDKLDAHYDALFANFTPDEALEFQEKVAAYIVEKQKAAEAVNASTPLTEDGQVDTDRVDSDASIDNPPPIEEDPNNDIEESTEALDESIRQMLNKQQDSENLTTLNVGRMMQETILETRAPEIRMSLPRVSGHSRGARARAKNNIVESIGKKYLVSFDEQEIDPSVPREVVNINAHPAMGLFNEGKIPVKKKDKFKLPDNLQLLYSKRIPSERLDEKKGKPFNKVFVPIVGKFEYYENKGVYDEMLAYYLEHGHLNHPQILRRILADVFRDASAIAQGHRGVQEIRYYELLMSSFDFDDDDVYDALVSVATAYGVPSNVLLEPEIEAQLREDDIEFVRDGGKYVNYRHRDMPELTTQWTGDLPYELRHQQFVNPFYEKWYMSTYLGHRFKRRAADPNIGKAAAIEMRNMDMALMMKAWLNMETMVYLTGGHAHIIDPDAFADQRRHILKHINFGQLMGREMVGEYRYPSAPEILVDLQKNWFFKRMRGLVFLSPEKFDVDGYADELIPSVVNPELRQTPIDYDEDNPIPSRDVEKMFSPTTHITTPYTAKAGTYAVFGFTVHTQAEDAPRIKIKYNFNQKELRRKQGQVQITYSYNGQSQEVYIPGHLIKEVVEVNDSNNVTRKYIDITNPHELGEHIFQDIFRAWSSSAIFEESDIGIGSSLLDRPKRVKGATFKRLGEVTPYQRAQTLSEMAAKADKHRTLYNAVVAYSTGNPLHQEEENELIKQRKKFYSSGKRNPNIINIRHVNSFLNMNYNPKEALSSGYITSPRLLTQTDAYKIIQGEKDVLAFIPGGTGERGSAKVTESGGAIEISMLAKEGEQTVVRTLPLTYGDDQKISMGTPIGADFSTGIKWRGDESRDTDTTTAWGFASELEEESFSALDDEDLSPAEREAKKRALEEGVTQRSLRKGARGLQKTYQERQLQQVAGVQKAAYENYIEKQGGKGKIPKPLKATIKPKSLPELEAELEEFVETANQEKAEGATAEEIANNEAIIDRLSDRIFAIKETVKRENEARKEQVAAGKISKFEEYRYDPGPAEQNIITDMQAEKYAKEIRNLYEAGELDYGPYIRAENSYNKWAADTGRISPIEGEQADWTNNRVQVGTFTAKLRLTNPAPVTRADYLEVTGLRDAFKKEAYYLYNVAKLPESEIRRRLDSKKQENLEIMARNIGFNSYAEYSRSDSPLKQAFETTGVYLVHVMPIHVPGGLQRALKQEVVPSEAGLSPKEQAQRILQENAKRQAGQVPANPEAVSDDIPGLGGFSSRQNKYINSASSQLTYVIDQLTRSQSERSGKYALYSNKFSEAQAKRLKSLGEFYDNFTDTERKVLEVLIQAEDRSDTKKGVAYNDGEVVHHYTAGGSADAMIKLSNKIGETFTNGELDLVDKADKLGLFRTLLEGDTVEEKFIERFAANDNEIYNKIKSEFKLFTMFINTLRELDSTHQYFATWQDAAEKARDRIDQITAEYVDVEVTEMRDIIRSTGSKTSIAEAQKLERLSREFIEDLKENSIAELNIENLHFNYEEGVAGFEMTEGRLPKIEYTKPRMEYVQRGKADDYMRALYKKIDKYNSAIKGIDSIYEKYLSELRPSEVERVEVKKKGRKMPASVQTELRMAAQLLKEFETISKYYDVAFDNASKKNHSVTIKAIMNDSLPITGRGTIATRGLSHSTNHGTPRSLMQNVVRSVTINEEGGEISASGDALIDAQEALTQQQEVYNAWTENWNIETARAVQAHQINQGILLPGDGALFESNQIMMDEAANEYYFEQPSADVDMRLLLAPGEDMAGIFLEKEMPDNLAGVSIIVYGDPKGLHVKATRADDNLWLTERVNPKENKSGKWMNDVLHADLTGHQLEQMYGHLGHTIIKRLAEDVDIRGLTDAQKVAYYNRHGEQYTLQETAKLIEDYFDGTRPLYVPKRKGDVTSITVAGLDNLDSANIKLDALADQNELSFETVDALPLQNDQIITVTSVPEKELSLLNDEMQKAYGNVRPKKMPEHYVYDVKRERFYAWRGADRFVWMTEPPYMSGKVHFRINNGTIDGITKAFEHLQNQTNMRFAAEQAFAALDPTDLPEPGVESPVVEGILSDVLDVEVMSNGNVVRWTQADMDQGVIDAWARAEKIPNNIATERSGLLGLLNPNENYFFNIIEDYGPDEPVKGRYTNIFSAIKEMSPPPANAELPLDPFQRPMNKSSFNVAIRAIASRIAQQPDLISKIVADMGSPDDAKNIVDNLVFSQPNIDPSWQGIGEASGMLRAYKLAIDLVIRNTKFIDQGRHFEVVVPREFGDDYFLIADEKARNYYWMNVPPEGKQNVRSAAAEFVITSDANDTGVIMKQDHTPNTGKASDAINTRVSDNPGKDAQDGLGTNVLSKIGTWEHFGNPFHKDPSNQKKYLLGLEKYNRWLRGKDRYRKHTDQLLWINQMIDQGRLDGATLLHNSDQANNHAEVLKSYIIARRAGKIKSVERKHKDDIAAKAAIKKGQLVSRDQNGQSIRYFKMISGGAYGADTVWGQMLKEFGMPAKNIDHIFSHLNTNAKRLEEFKGRVLDAKRRGQVKREADRLGVSIPATIKPPLKKEKAKYAAWKKRGGPVQYALTIRSIEQALKAESVIAVGEIGAAGKNTKRQHPLGGTKYAVITAIKQDKPAYLWDVKTMRWYQGVKVGKGFTMEPIASAPKLTKTTALVGTRKLQVYKVPGQKDPSGKVLTWKESDALDEPVREAAKKAMADVVYRTFTQEVVDPVQSGEPNWEATRERIENLSHKELIAELETLPIPDKEQATTKKERKKILMKWYKKQWKKGKAGTQAVVQIITTKYSRASLDQDPNSMYLFTDNAERTSRPGASKPNITTGWYAEKYKSKTDKPLHYGTAKNPTSAVIRGKNNAYPISTMSAYGTNWTNKNFDKFKKVIDDEISQIKKDLPKFNALKIGDFRIGQGGRNAKLPKKHQEYLDAKLLELGIDNTGTSPKIVETTKAAKSKPKSSSEASFVMGADSPLGLMSFDFGTTLAEKAEAPDPDPDPDEDIEIDDDEAEGYETAQGDDLDFGITEHVGLLGRPLFIGDPNGDYRLLDNELPKNFKQLLDSKWRIEHLNVAKAADDAEDWRKIMRNYAKKRNEDERDYDEALTWYIEGTGSNHGRLGDMTASQIQRYIDERPPLKNIAEKIGAATKALGENLNTLYSQTDLIDQGAEYIQFLDRYLAHFYTNNTDNMRKALEDKVQAFKIRSRSAEERRIVSYYDAVNAELEPRTLKATQIHVMYAQMNYNIIAQRIAFDNMLKMKDEAGDSIMILAEPGGNSLTVPQMSTEPSSLKRKWYKKREPSINYIYRDAPHISEHGVYLHPDAKAMWDRITHTPVDNIVLDGIEMFNSIQKKLWLSVSAFHIGALNESGFSIVRMMNIMFPKLYLPGGGKKFAGIEYFMQPLRAMRKNLEMHPELLDEAIRNHVMVGTPSDYQLDKFYQFNESLREKMSWSPALVALHDKHMGIHRGMDAIIWDHVHTNWKMLAYLDIRERMRERHGVRGDTSELRQAIGDLVNDAFGGQRWETMENVPPFVERILRNVMLAPDWTYSNLRIAFRPHVDPNFPKELREIHHSYWVKMITFQAIGAWMLQSFIKETFGEDDEYMTDNPFTNPGKMAFGYVDITPIIYKHPLVAKIGGATDEELQRGQRYYTHAGKQWREVLKLFMEPLKYATAKTSPAVQTGWEWVSGNSVNGWEKDWKREPFWSEKSAVTRATAVAKTFMPFSIQGLYEGDGPSGGSFLLTTPINREVTLNSLRIAFDKRLRFYLENEAKVDDIMTLGLDLVQLGMRNGFRDDQIRSAMGGAAVSQEQYEKFWKLWEEGDRAAIEKQLMVLDKLGKDLQGLRSSALRKFGKESDVYRALKGEPNE